MEKKYEMRSELKFRLCLPRPIKLTFKITCNACTTTAEPIILYLEYTYATYVPCLHRLHWMPLAPILTTDVWAEKKLIRIGSTWRTQIDLNIKWNSMRSYLRYSPESQYAKKNRRAFHCSFFRSRIRSLIHFRIIMCFLCTVQHQHDVLYSI